LKEKLEISRIERENLMMIIENDAKFLSQNNLMDYSLLFIKAKTPTLSSKESSFKVMPALVYVKG